MKKISGRLLNMSFLSGIVDKDFHFVESINIFDLFPICKRCLFKKQQKVIILINKFMSTNENLRICSKLLMGAKLFFKCSYFFCGFEIIFQCLLLLYSKSIFKR